MAYQPKITSEMLNISLIDDLRKSFPFNGSALQKAFNKTPEAPIFKLLLTQPGKTFLERAYRLLNGSPTCKMCGKLTPFYGVTKGFAIYCSNNCKNSDKDFQKTLSEKRCTSMMKRYGSRGTLGNKELRKKANNTINEKYVNGQIRQKIEATNLKKYGVTVPAKNKEIAKRSGLKKRLSTIRKRRHEVEKLGFKILTKELLHGDDVLFLECPKGHSFEHNWADLQREPICRVCSPIMRGSSYKEQELQKWCASIGKIECNKRIYVDTKSYVELDIFFPDYNLAIEFNGLHWHSEECGKGKDYHLRKKEIAKAHGISLIHIFEHQYEETPDIVRSIILNRIGVNSKIFARTLIVKNLSPKEKSEWFKTTHLHGDAKSAYAFGLFSTSGTLVAAASFSPNRYGKDKSVYELIRFSSALNTTVVGGMNKLIAAAQKQIGFSKLKSFCDRNLFDGAGYKSAGFTLIGISQPSYWYFNRSGVYHRSMFQRKKLIKLLSKAEGTERELAKEYGLNRFWDCGNYIFERTF